MVRDTTGLWIYFKNLTECMCECTHWASSNQVSCAAQPEDERDMLVVVSRRIYFTLSFRRLDFYQSQLCKTYVLICFFVFFFSFWKSEVGTERTMRLLGFECRGSKISVNLLFLSWYEYFPNLCKIRDHNNNLEWQQWSGESSLLHLSVIFKFL